MNNNEKKLDIVIWGITLFSCILCAWLVNKFFNELNTGCPTFPLYTIIAFKLLGTLWPIAVLTVTSSILLALKFMRRGLIITIFIAIMIVIQSVLLSVIIGKGYTPIELESAELHYLYHVISLSKSATMIFLFFLGVAIWICEKVRLQIVSQHKSMVVGSEIVESVTVLNRLRNFFKNKN